MMKRLASCVLLFLAAAPVLFAQQATLATPESGVTATKIVVVDLLIRRDCACAVITVEYQDNGGAAKRQQVYNVPQDPATPGTELATFLGAIGSPRATETGGAARKLNFRTLGYLGDAGRLPPGTTLVP